MRCTAELCQYFSRRGRVRDAGPRSFTRLVAAAVAATPFINFALFLDYRPAGARGLFKLWA
jgi:hypothetical protein